MSEEEVYSHFLKTMAVSMLMLADVRWVKTRWIGSARTMIGLRV